MASSKGSAAARIIDGKAIAARLRARVGEEARRLNAEHGLVPGLAVILLGEDAASQVYVGAKRRETAAAGMHSVERNLPAGIGEAELLAEIDRLNRDRAVHGILVQLPLPAHIREAAVIEALDPRKDVDGFHTRNVGLLWTGGEGMAPCTPTGCLMLLDWACSGALEGRRAVVLGRSNIVGKPVAALLLRRSCTVTLAHSKTRDLPEECRRADILVAAVGRPEMVRGSWIKPGAVVIDVGINRVAGEAAGKSRLVGDVAFAEAALVASAITPVPGGVGPMTIACLLRNCLVAACRQSGIPAPEL
jgi:methylenetetrahydrofolate dehydrogenase (NADP+)/methenyltetrahydrofolate cyclohydrolase